MSRGYDTIEDRRLISCLFNLVQHPPGLAMIPLQHVRFCRSEVHFSIILRLYAVLLTTHPVLFSLRSMFVYRVEVRLCMSPLCVCADGQIGLHMHVVLAE